MDTPVTSAPFLEAIFLSSPDVVVVVDDHGTIVFANDRCTHLLGFEPAELVGKSIEMLVPAQFARHAEMRAEYQRNPITRPMGKRPVLSVQHKSGNLVPVDIALSPLPPFPGHDKLVQAVIRDAMPRWSVQQDLLVQSVAMDAAANGIVITDLKGVIEWVNPAVTRMTGYASEELVGRHTRLLKSNHHDDRVLSRISGPPCWPATPGSARWPIGGRTARSISRSSTSRRSGTATATSRTSSPSSRT